jgi:hypothetical protein
MQQGAGMVHLVWMGVEKEEKRIQEEEATSIDITPFWSCKGQNSRLSLRFHCPDVVPAVVADVFLARLLTK